jgi:hypothetical protein
LHRLSRNTGHYTDDGANEYQRAELHQVSIEIFPIRIHRKSSSSFCNDKVVYSQGEKGVIQEYGLELAIRLQFSYTNIMNFLQHVIAG